MERETEHRSGRRAVRISAGAIELEGNLGVVEGAEGRCSPTARAQAETVPETSTSPGCYVKLASLRS